VGVTIGAVLRAARSVRGLSSTETARGAGISPAYLSRLENDAVKRPSPGVLHRLGEVLKVPYSELMTLVGYRVSDADDGAHPARLDATIFTDLTDDEREELIAYLAWYRERKRSRRDLRAASAADAGERRS